MKTTIPPFRGARGYHDPFDPEAFIQLLIKQQVKKTSRKENTYIKSILQESAEARNILEDFGETSNEFHWTLPPRKRFPLYIAAGAALLLTTGAGYFFFLRQGQPDVQSWKAMEVRKGTTSTIKLADGTEVKVNAATTLRYPASFTKNKREVYMEGEAFFNVAADAEKPFIVHTALADIEVLGTSFNVRTYDSSFRAALVSGAIAVSTHEGEKIKLLPGYIASLEAPKSQLLVSSFVKDTVLTWTTGTYRFENKPLKEVCRMVERIYDISVIIDDKALAESRYSGTIHRKQPIHFLLEDLGYTDGVDYHFDKEGKLHLKRSGATAP